MTTRTMPLHLTVLLIGAVSMGAAGSSASAKGSSTLPDWKPNETLLQQLAPDTRLYNFLFRPPQGYVRIPQLQKIPGWPGDAFFWAGTPRPDGSTPNFIILSSATSRFGRSRITADQGLRLVMDLVRKRLQAVAPVWTHTQPQKGSVSGMLFERSFWKSKIPGNGVTAHGFAYDTIQNSQIFAFASFDLEPYWQDTLNLAEAATLSFHRM